MKTGKTSWIYNSLGRKVAMPLVVGTLIFALVIIYAVYSFQMQGVEEQAIKQAQGVNAQFTDTEALLAEQERLSRHLVHQVSERLNQRGLMKIRLISSSPINPDRTPASEWEEKALASLVGDPHGARTNLETGKDTSRLLYMTPILASAEACVTCHNNTRQGLEKGLSELCQSCHGDTHNGRGDVEAGSCTYCHDPHDIVIIRDLVPSSVGGNPGPGEPSGEIVLGDMVGALVVEVPVTDALAAARSRAIWLSLGTLSALAGFVGLVLYFQNRMVVLPVKGLARAANKLSGGDLAVELSVQSGDEIGQMTHAFGNLVAYIRGMASVATRLSEGDLTAEVAPQSDEDVLGNAFAQMTGNLRDLIGQVTDAADAVGTASGQLSAAADQSAQAASQVAITIQQVAQGTAQQTASVTQATTTVEQVVQVIGGVGHGTQKQAAAVAQSAEITNRISTAIQQMVTNVQRMESVREMVEFSAHKVQEMGQHSRQIVTIITTLEDLAAQTNMLALNAAIEAAQAKEHGRSFAVVASEVRKLAQRSSAETKEITALIRRVQQTVAEAVAVMEQSALEVNRQVAEISTATQQMSDASSDLVRAVDAVSTVAEANTAATVEMEIGADEVSQAIEDIAVVAEENSAAAEEVSAAVEEMSTQAEEVTASAQSLNAMADRLLSNVSHFRVQNTAERG